MALKMFRISEINSSTDNHRSCFAYRELVEKEQLYKQILEGNYAKSNVKPKIISPIGAIKKDDSNDVRIIYDASVPVGYAMNNYNTPFSVSYQSVNDACKYATKNSYLAKIDLKSAY